MLVTVFIIFFTTYFVIKENTHCYCTCSHLKITDTFLDQIIQLSVCEELIVSEIEALPLHHVYSVTVQYSTVNYK